MYICSITFSLFRHLLARFSTINVNFVYKENKLREQERKREVKKKWRKPTFHDLLFFFFFAFFLILLNVRPFTLPSNAYIDRVWATYALFICLLMSEGTPLSFVSLRIGRCC